MSPQYDVDTEQLHGHASTVGEIADQLSAVGGRLPSGLADMALGLFAQFLATGLQGAMTQVANTVTGASSAVAELSTGIHRTATGYQYDDEGNAENLSQEYVR